jgi:peptide/nickel transport system permease protein
VGHLAVRRLGLGVVVLAGLSVASFCFFASQTEPYSEHALLPQYWTWLKGLFTGASLHPFQGLTLLYAVGHTACLLAVGLAVVVVAGIAFATVAAHRRGSAVDLLLRATSYLAWGIPAFLLALLIQEGLQSVGTAHGLGPFPIAGWPGSCPAGIGIGHGTITPCPAAGTGVRFVLNVLRYVTLPALTLAAAFVGLHGRYLRSALVETLDAPFVVTARAKGLPERQVLVRHALRASLVTFASALLADFGTVLGSALAVDWLFQLHGIGWLFVYQFPTESYAPLNVYALQLLVLVIAAIVIVSSLLGELVITSLDPRLRGEA